VKKDKIIIFTITTIIIFLLGIAAHIQFFQTKTNVIDLYSKKQITLANQAAISLETFIKGRIKAIEILADFPASRKLDKKIYITEYKRTYEIVKGFQYILFVDTQGVAQIGYPKNYPCPSQQSHEIKKSFQEIFQ